MMDAPSPPHIMVDRVGVGDEAECGEDVDLPTDDHLMTLKALTEKLRLETRRPSYLEWKARLEAESFTESGPGKCPIQMEPESLKLLTPKEAVVNSGVTQCKLPSGVLKGFGNIDEALGWLRRELVGCCCFTMYIKYLLGCILQIQMNSHSEEKMFAVKGQRQNGDNVMPLSQLNFNNAHNAQLLRRRVHLN